MARFLLSPGVLTREIDNSQYASTQPTGSVVAMVGYSEKGPFEPTLVGGKEEFNKVFGYTLEDAPYLAQGAYKYFGQGHSLLVVRAGDNRDPELYPQAAQYATKTVRLGERDVAATKGFQTFTRANELAAGTFAPGAEFGFKVDADHRAFIDPKMVESWDVVLHEERNGAGAAVPSIEFETAVKFAYDKDGDKLLEASFKENDVVNGKTFEKAGTSNRTGVSFGDTVTGTVYNYAVDGTFSDNNANYIYYDAKHAAIALGTSDMKAGFDWATANQDLKFTLDNVSYSITLDLGTVTAAEVVAHINNKLQNAVDENTANIIDLSGDIEAFFVTPKLDGSTFVGLRKIGSVVSNISANSFTVNMSTAVTQLGIQAKEYKDSESVYGSFHSETGDVNGVYDGKIIMTKKGATENAVETFEESIDVAVTAPDSGSWALSDIVTQINVYLNAGHAGYTNNPARAIAEVDAASGKVQLITKLAAADKRRSMIRIKNNESNSLIDLLGLDLPTDGEQEKPVGESIISLSAAEKGSHGNELVLRTETKTAQVGPNTVENYYNVYIVLNGKEVSAYQRISWDDSTSDRFLPALLESDLYLRMEAEDEDGNFVLEMLPDGDWVLGTNELPEGVSSLTANVIDYSTGTNGWTEDSDGVITSMDADLINGLKKIYNPEVYDFNIVSAPGAAASSVQNEVQALCESRHDCFGVVDAAPFGYGLGVKEGLNHVSEINALNENLNSSYVGAYWPWLQDYDADNKQYVWLPPSIYAVTQMVYTDNVADPWFATAGLNRGKVTALDVEYSPTSSDRDILYGNSNVINPIVKFVGEGIAIWGQKTCQRTNSALNRINVRRLMIYAEKLIARMARGFLFEQSDASNWSAFARQANAILEPIRQRQGLYTYSVVCDDTTNTPDLIDQNIMKGKIFVQPTKTIEFLEVDFTINSTGDVEFSE